jgi:hypothetical protein
MDEAERNVLREKWFTQLAAQRVMTRSQDRQLRDTKTKLTRCRKKLLRAEIVTDPNGPDAGALRVVALEAEESQLCLEVEAMMEERRVAARRAIQPYLDDPPAPLRDMRRPDEHREAYVGKGVRAKNAEHWRGMPAVAGSGSIKNHTKKLFEGVVTAEP